MSERPANDDFEGQINNIKAQLDNLHAKFKAVNDENTTLKNGKALEDANTIIKQLTHAAAYYRGACLRVGLGDVDGSVAGVMMAKTDGYTRALKDPHSKTILELSKDLQNATTAQLARYFPPPPAPNQDSITPDVAALATRAGERVRVRSRFSPNPITPHSAVQINKPETSVAVQRPTRPFAAPAPAIPPATKRATASAKRPKLFIYESDDGLDDDRFRDPNEPFGTTPRRRRKRDLNPEAIKRANEIIMVQY